MKNGVMTFSIGATTPRNKKRNGNELGVNALIICLLFEMQISDKGSLRSPGERSEPLIRNVRYLVFFLLYIIFYYFSFYIFSIIYTSYFGIDRRMIVRPINSFLPWHRSLSSCLGFVIDSGTLYSMRSHYF